MGYGLSRLGGMGSKMGRHGGRYRRFQGHRDLGVANEVWLCIGSVLLQARHILCQFWTEIFGRKVMSSVPRKK